MPSLPSELSSARTVTWTGSDRQLLLQCTACLSISVWEIASWMGACICFLVKGTSEIGMWVLGDTSLTQRSTKVYGDSVRICVMSRPQGFGKK